MKRSATATSGSTGNEGSPSKKVAIKETGPGTESDALDSKVPAKLAPDTTAKKASSKDAAEDTSTSISGAEKPTVSTLLDAASADGAPTERLKRFPERLIELLNTEAAAKSLYWLPGGKAFAIEQQTFSSEVLDKFFQATKFSSFVRRLHKWGFRRETRGFRKEHGPDFSRSVIAFSHDLFQKDAPHLVEQMEEVAKKQQSESAAGRRGSASGSSIKSGPSDPQLREDGSTSARLPPRQDSTGSSIPQNPSDSSFKLNNQGASALSGDSAVRDTSLIGAGPTGTTGAASALGAVGALGSPTQQQLQQLQLQQQGASQGSSSGIQQEFLLRNLRNNAMETSSSIEALLRQQQQQNDSFLQRDIIAASLELQQQDWQRQQRATFLASASQNQALLDAAARERILQLGLSLPQQPALPQQQLGAVARLGDTRLSSVRGENNSQLMETLLLMELQRQRQQGSQPGSQQGQQPPPGGFRQFPPFG